MDIILESEKKMLSLYPPYEFLFTLFALVLPSMSIITD